MAHDRPHEQPQAPPPHGHRYARVPGDVAQTDVAAMAMQAQRSHMTENVYCIIWSLVSIAVLALACALLSMTQKERTTERLRGGEALLVDLANALMTLMNEAMYALYYTYNAASPDPKVPILEQQRQLSLLQSATLATVQQSARESAALCPECASFFELLGYSGLLLVQNIARRRDFALTQVNSLYVDALTKYASALAYYLGISVNTVAAQMLRLESLVRAASGMGTMAQSWRGAHADAALLPSAYNMTSIYLAAIRGASVSVTSATAQQDIHGGGGGDGSDPAAAFARAVSAYVSNVTGVMSNVTGKFDDLHVDNFDNHSATDLIGLLTTRFAESLTSITTTPQYKQQPSMRLLTVRTVLLAVIMVLLVIVNGIIVRDLCLLAMHAERNLRKLRDVQRTQASLRRMSHFLDCLGRLDVRGMRATTTRSHRDATRTAAEDELMKLEAPALEVLAYIDPCILDCAAAAASSSSAAAAAAANATHVVVSTGDDDDGAAAAAAAGAGRGGGGAHAMGAAALPWLSSPSVVPLGLAPRNVCVLLADLSATFCNEVNHDSAKTMPKQVEMFAHTLASYARELGGVVMGTSGTVLMLGWNVLTTQQHQHNHTHSAHANTHHHGQRHLSYQQQQHHPQPANAACAMLLRVRDSLAKSHPQVRYAVVSSTCPAGVVGSATLHSFVLASPLLQLGRLLLHVARLHDVCFVVDSITCRLVDECVCKRALERVALSPATVGHPDGDTIVYELTPLTASEYESVALWNDAFDCLQACSLATARAKAAAWERRYGATTSLRRFVRLLHEKPTPRTHTFLAMSASSSGRHPGIDLETIM